jgi:hypothetical protein
MRLYLKREVIMAQWLKDDKKLRDNAERARDRAINSSPPPSTGTQNTRAAGSVWHAKPARSRLHLVWRITVWNCSDSRMCEEYIQHGGHIDAVVEMMIEMSSSLLHPVPGADPDARVRALYWRRTPRSRDVGVSRALGQG